MLYLLRKDDRPLFVNLDHVTAVGAHPHPTEATPYAVWIRKDPSCNQESYGISMVQYLEILHALDIAIPWKNPGGLQGHRPKPRTTSTGTTTADPDAQQTSSAGTRDPKYAQCQNADTEDDVDCPKEDRMTVRHVWEAHDIDL